MTAITPLGPEPEERSSFAIARVATGAKTQMTPATARWLWSSTLEGWSKVLPDGTITFIGKEQFAAFEKLHRGPRGDKLRGVRGPERLDMIAGLLPVPA